MFKINILSAFLLFVISYSTTAQNKITSLPNITLSLSQNNYNGKYAGEVNDANQPNGYGLFIFKDSAVYMVGQFVNGQLTGNAVMLDSNTQTALISDRENGFKKETAFLFNKKTLSYLKLINGKSYPIRTSRFLYNKIYALCRSGLEVNKPTLSDFSIDFSDEASPRVQYSSIINDDGNLVGPNVEYYYSNNTAITTYYMAGKKTDNGTGYYSGGYHREEDIASHLNNKVPYWLKGAQFNKVTDTKDLIFLKNPQQLGENTAYAMKWIINQNRNEASMTVSAFTNWVKPVGFLQEISVRNEQYDYYMGNFNKEESMSGVGITVQCNKKDENFFINAGNLFKNASGRTLTKNGFDIRYFEKTFVIYIGELDNNTAMINGYFIEPGRQLFF